MKDDTKIAQLCASQLMRLSVTRSRGSPIKNLFPVLNTIVLLISAYVSISISCGPFNYTWMWGDFINNYARMLSYGEGGGVEIWILLYRFGKSMKDV